jgi:hypothetical protein
MISSAKNKKKGQRPDDPEQSRLFIKKAREIGADEETSKADALLGKLHEKPPKSHAKKDKDA